jgi:hypothetical protein
MAHSTCHPLREFRVARLREEATIIVVRICISVCVAIGITTLVGRVRVLPVPLLLLADVYEHEKRRGQPDDKKSLEDAIVNIKIQIVIISVTLICLDRAHEVLIVFASFVELVVIIGSVIFNESRNPFFEGTARSRI